MGYHDCEFCNGSEDFVSWDWRKMTDNPHSIKPPTCGEHCLGSGDILVFGPEEIYIAPDLIYHYISDHDYSPPDEFVQAVLSSPLPNSAEYFARMMEYYHGKP